MQQKRNIILLIIIVVTVSGFMLLRYLPRRKNLKTIAQKREAQKLTISQGQTAAVNIEKLHQELENLQLATENYNLKIPATRELGPFLQQIATMMDGCELKNQVVEPLSETTVDNLICIPVNMKCNGSLQSIFDFFNSLKNIDRLVRIEQVVLENVKGFTGEIRMESKAFIYYEPKDLKG